MKNKKLIVAAIILCIVLATTIVICRPYSYVELNAGTIYYQSFLNLKGNAGQYVGMLENYNESRDEIYLERALIKLDAIRDSIWIFRIANGMSFRNTYINEKVVKTDFLGLQNLESLETSYYSSRNVFEEFLKGDVVLDDKSFEDFTHYNELILKGLQTDDIGYNPETKEFRVVLDDSKKPLLEEGLEGLREILIRVITP